MKKRAIILDRQTDRQTDKYICIQLLRIIACLGEFVVHFGQRVNFSGSIRTLTDFGAKGVQLFFIISGFLAANGLEKQKCWKILLQESCSNSSALLPGTSVVFYN